MKAPSQHGSGLIGRVGPCQGGAGRSDFFLDRIGKAAWHPGERLSGVPWHHVEKADLAREVEVMLDQEPRLVQNLGDKGMDHSLIRAEATEEKCRTKTADFVRGVSAKRATVGTCWDSPEECAQLQPWEQTLLIPLLFLRALPGPQIRWVGTSHCKGGFRARSTNCQCVCVLPV